jgi:hypothetical protein
MHYLWENQGGIVKRAKEAIEGFIEGLQKAGEPIPEEVSRVEMDTVIVWQTFREVPGNGARIRG